MRIIKQQLRLSRRTWYAEDAAENFRSTQGKDSFQYGRAYPEFGDCDRGSQIPAGETYFEAKSEGAPGLSGFKRGGVPYRLKTRAPSFCNLSILKIGSRSYACRHHRNSEA